MSIYNWLEADTLVKGYNHRKHYWHAFLSSNELQDLKDNWPAIYNSSYHRRYTATDVKMWVGEFKDHLQQNLMVDEGGLTFDAEQLYYKRWSLENQLPR